MDFELFVSDRWGNLIKGYFGPIDIHYDEEKVEFVRPLDSDKDGEV
jgi:hypothetical protein